RGGDRARGAAAGLDVCAAARESAADRPRQRGFDLTRNRDERRLPLVSAERGQTIEQPARVWVPRVREDLAHRAFLDELATVHDADAVAHARDAAEVVTDEQDRGTMASTQLAHEVEHRGLDRDVEARGGLVHDQERGARDERHRDDDALLLT